ncbi:MAG: GNAT family N-acetyltransferase [Desulfobacteraceae bacterium]|nr:MAG: GNAT family N-acetyltransferase [Desulfobacteraceae bacterium]
MPGRELEDWRSLLVTPDKVWKRIRPGMRIFLSTGAAEPRTLVEGLAHEEGNLQDLELFQVLSLGQAVSPEQLSLGKYRLKTFYAGWIAGEAITSGMVDLIPSRFSNIPALIQTGRVAIDAAMIQITPPDEEGYCTLGISVDVARKAMKQAPLVVGEVNPFVPRTFGDTRVSISDFDLLVESRKPPYYLDRWPVEKRLEELAASVASVIDDGSCVSFGVGSFYEALGRQLRQKQDLGVHSPFFTDALMELVQSGAVTNLKKAVCTGRSVTSYAVGSQALYGWLDRNPLVEFHEMDKVWDPLRMGQNEKFIAAIPARRIDLSGRIAPLFGPTVLATSPSDLVDLVNAAQISRRGRTIFALPSRNRRGESNIRLSIQELPNLFTLWESVDMVATEYGVANLRGRTLRERAQALIDIAHPDFRSELVSKARAENILYRDQIFIANSGHIYPQDVAVEHAFKNVHVRFRGIRPSDEEEMRRFFYRFSDKSIYYRYCTHVKAMPHSLMQKYVNVDYRASLAIVGLIGDFGHGRIIAESRYVKLPEGDLAEVAFFVDEAYQNLGIASFMLKLLKEAARRRGIRGFTAEVLTSNAAMMKVFEKSDPVNATVETGSFYLTMPFETGSPSPTLS